ncbi:MAG: GreA/GreB family elongation factor [Bacteroidales bacterium]|nr:GreA/GreB family elongation factor [Bacteroidales bacterium]
MSRGFVKDGDIEEVPAVEQRAWIPDGVANLVTPEGLASLNAEREDIIARRDSASGNETDLRITRNYLNAKLQLLEERISSAVVPQIGEQPGRVGFGAYVTVRINGGKNRTFRIVGADEADAAKGLVSFFSPVAKAIAGRGAGETVTSGLPAGNREVEIVEVSYEPLPLTLAQAQARPVHIHNHHSARPVADDVSAVRETAAKVPSEETGRLESAPVKRDDPFEMLPLVNERGVTVGKATRKECHNGTKLLHPVVHLHLFNGDGALYLQKRPDWKEIQPGKWDTAVGGHIAFGEPVGDALRREVREEIGLETFEPVLLGKYIFESARDREYVYVYRAVSDVTPVPSDELEEGRFWTPEELAANFGKKVFTPNFELEYKKFFGKK